MSSYAAYLAFAEALAKEAGHIAHAYERHAISFEHKSDNSPVTDADLKINSLVIARCRAAYPDIGVLGEEESIASAKTSGFLWVCDPIDGTIPYSMGMSASMFCLALVEDGVPVVGVAYDFANDRLFSAVKGAGVRLNGEPIEPPGDVKPMRFVDLEWWPSSIYQLQEARSRLESSNLSTLFIASSVFAGTMVVLRRLMAVVYGSSKPWDGAALYVIATEMGAKMTNLDGEVQRYDQPIKGFILANTDDFDAIFACVGGNYTKTTP